MKQSDWSVLWRKLVITNLNLKQVGFTSGYEGRPDMLLDFALRETGKVESVLDIGAGAGRWTVPFSRIANTVTAVEPSEKMLHNLHRNIAVTGINNIRIISVYWQDAIVEPHDIVICAHGIYSSPDFPSFIQKMVQSANQRCYLELRLPPSDGIIGELFNKIYGHFHDSPNAMIAYNALYSMGIYANVLIENDIHNWVDVSIEDAFIRAKRYLHLDQTTDRDILVLDTLHRRLVYSNNSYIWPDGMRSALLWWSI